jgi:hypothetical protein
VKPRRIAAVRYAVGGAFNSGLHRRSPSKGDPTAIASDMPSA